MKFVLYLLLFVMDFLSAAVGGSTRGTGKDFLVGLVAFLIVVFLWFAVLSIITDKTMLKNWLCYLSATAITVAVIAVFFGISILIE